jgi:hypothetical protein
LAILIHLYVRRGTLPEDWAGEIEEGTFAYGELHESAKPFAEQRAGIGPGHCMG